MAVIPKVSIVVVVHRMARQAAHTLRSLSPGFQRHVAPSEYEVIVVENDSDDLLGAEVTLGMGGNFRYFHRQDTRRSPAFAFTVGVSQTRAPFVGALLDGAYLLTPRVVEFAIIAARCAQGAVVVVPPYHLGPAQQHKSQMNGYDATAELQALASIDWERAPYRMFEIGVAAPGAGAGYLRALGEAGCLFVSRRTFRQLRPGYERFIEPGGGGIATYLLHESCRRDGAELFVLAGEGAFHQIHGGVFTSPHENRAALLGRRSRNLAAIAGGSFQYASLEPRLLGAFTGQAQGQLKLSASLFGDVGASSRPDAELTDDA